MDLISNCATLEHPTPKPGFPVSARAGCGAYHDGGVMFLFFLFKITHIGEE
jgi:hypothetical protein